MLGCLAAELNPSLRVVVAEEVFESDIPSAGVEASLGWILGTEAGHTP